MPQLEADVGAGAAPPNAACHARRRCKWRHGVAARSCQRGGGTHRRRRECAAGRGRVGGAEQVVGRRRVPPVVRAVTQQHRPQLGRQAAARLRMRVGIAQGGAQERVVHHARDKGVGVDVPDVRVVRQPLRHLVRAVARHAVLPPKRRPLQPAQVRRPRTLRLAGDGLRPRRHLPLDGPRRALVRRVRRPHVGQRAQDGAVQPEGVRRRQQEREQEGSQHALHLVPRPATDAAPHNDDAGALHGAAVAGDRRGYGRGGQGAARRHLGGHPGPHEVMAGSKGAQEAPQRRAAGGQPSGRGGVVRGHGAVA